MDQQENPNLVISSLKKISPQVRAAFAGALLFGLFAQGMGLFNKFSHHDDVAILFELGTTVSSGRWTLQIFTILEELFYGTGHASLPLFNGTISLLCIGAAAGLLVRLLKIDSRPFCFLAGGLLAVFPVVTALFAYMFTSHVYLIGLVMMVVCAFLICRKGPWWAKVIGILLGGAGIGVYQAFLPVTAAAILFCHIMELSEGKGSFREWVSLALIHVFCLAGVMLVYMAGNRFFLAKYQVELSSYMGISEMGRMTLQTLLNRLGRAYGLFFNPARALYPGTLRVLYLLMLVLEGLLLLRLLLRTARKSKWRAGMLLLALALVPLAVNLIHVMVEEGIHALMVYGQVMHFLLFIWLCDRMDFSSRKLTSAASLGTALLLACAAVMYVRFDNQCYLKDTLHQQEAISYYTGLITRIKSTPGYRPEMEVFFCNAENAQDPSVYNIDELDFIQINPYWHNSQEYLQSPTRNDFMRVWCGADFPSGWDPNLESTPEVVAMPSYPADGSIQILNGAVVVKF